GTVHRSLRLQLIAIVVATVATVLAASQWLDTRLSESALDRDLEARALLYLRTVASLWGRTGAGALRRELQTLVAGDRDLTAVDVLLQRAGRFEPALTTRPAGEAVPPLELDPAHEGILLAMGAVRTATERREGAVIWRIASPMMRDGALEGVVQVEFSLLEIARLERNGTNATLWSAQLEVGRSERLAALGQMAATIAHELGTPLNSVLGYTQLLLREDLPAEQASKLAVIESQVQRMIETIRSVLGRTRDREIGRRPVALAPLVAEALALVATRLAGRELMLRHELALDLPPVTGDAAALRQVLINLLANAIDATEPPGEIVVGARVLS